MPSKQKVVIITGASRGIGAELARRFHHLGYGVVATSRSIKKSERGDDSDTLTIAGDIAEEDTAARVVNAEIGRAHV